MGQEAFAVGVLNAIDQEKDIVFSNHRAHGHFIAYGGPAQGLVFEVLRDLQRYRRQPAFTVEKFLHQRNPGGMVPSAVGAALAEKLKKFIAVTLVFIGGGTMGQGTVYESFNISALWKLPMKYLFTRTKVSS